MGLRPYKSRLVQVSILIEQNWILCCLHFRFSPLFFSIVFSFLLSVRLEMELTITLTHWLSHRCANVECLINCCLERTNVLCWILLHILQSHENKTESREKLKPDADRFICIDMCVYKHIYICICTYKQLTDETCLYQMSWVR